MYKKRHENFENINPILERVAKKLGFDRKLKEFTLLSFWPEIVGNKFRHNTKAISVIRKYDHEALVIAVASSIVSQELIFFKNDILKKISGMAISREFNIKDLIFNNKLWQDIKNEKISSKKEDPAIYFNKKPANEELEKTHVPEDIINSIKESINNQKFSSAELKDKIFNTIINDIKIQIWRKEKGFPCCEKCGIPVNRYIPDEKILCRSCVVNNQNSSQ